MIDMARPEAMYHRIAIFPKNSVKFIQKVVLAMADLRYTNS